MIKNNKGFTLIELLAAVAIFSILMVLALPQLTNLIGGNKDKVYISDALKMISQAEYKLRANSTVIEKPDEGECIIFSLNYLDNNSFDNPPNKGEYLRYSSFVIVKNDNGNMEYSALLVEEIDNNNYKGVKLTKEADLNKADAIKNVTNFNKNALVYINDDISAKYAGGDASDKTIGVNYINSFLGNNYVKAVNDRLVNDVAEQGDVDVESLAIPKINSFVVMPAVANTVNSFDVKFYVEAKDDDTPANDLTVYYNICTPNIKSKNPSLCNYPDITNPSVSGYSYSSGDSSSFTSSVISLNRCNNSGDYCAKYGQEVIVYLVITDKDGNSVKKQRKYKIPSYQAPGFKTFKIVKRDEDPANFMKAKVIAELDNNVNYAGLQYCLIENGNAGVQECTNFKPFTSSIIDYNFCTGDIYSAECMPDGSVKTLKIFIKDNQGNVISKKANYTIYRLNTEKLIPELTLSSHGLDVPHGENSLTIGYDINVPFDPKSGIEESDITYTIALCESDDSCDAPLYQTAPLSYKNSKIGTFKLFADNTLPLYNGLQRRVIAKVSVSKYGLDSNNSSFKTIENYVPYINKPPNVTDEITPTFIGVVDDFGYPKNPDEGTYRVTYHFSAKDDIDVKNFWTCLSESSTGCDFNNQAEFDALYQKYDENTQFTFTPENYDLPYDGSTKTLYIRMCDSYYLTPNMNSCFDTSTEYTIYNNKAPVIDSYSVDSVASTYNSNQTRITLKLNDDLEVLRDEPDEPDDPSEPEPDDPDDPGEPGEPEPDDPIVHVEINNLHVTITDGVNTISDLYKNLFDSEHHALFTLEDPDFYGYERNIKVIVEDSYGISVEQEFDYTISKNTAPEATEPPIIEPDYTEFSEDMKADGIHVRNIKVTSNFIDDRDAQSDLTVRVGYRKQGETEFTYTDEQPFESTLSFVIGDDESFAYDGSIYEIVIQAKDLDSLYSETPAITTYKVHNWQTAPLLLGTEFKNKCDSETGCDDAPINRPEFHVIAYVKDYFDTFNICVSESSTTCNEYTTEDYSGDNPSSGYQSLAYKLSVSDYSLNPPTKVYVYIKDSQGNLISRELSYDVYKSCQDENNMIETDVVHTPVNSNNAVSPISCNGICYKGVDDENLPERQFPYIRSFNLIDQYVTGQTCREGLSANEILFCDYENCFKNTEGNYTYYIIGSSVNEDRDTELEGQPVVEYTFSGTPTELDGKTFTKYHNVYKLGMVTDNEGYSEFGFVLQELKIPAEIDGMPDYDFRTYFPFDPNNDESYLIVDDFVPDDSPEGDTP